MPVAARCLVVAVAVAACHPGNETLAQGFTMRRPPEFGVEVAGPRSRLANPEDWPVTFIFRISGGPGCTATAIAEQAVMTAAHCLPSGGDGTLVIGNRQWAVTCEKHPRWPQTRSADFALCHIATPLSDPPAGFETLAMDAAAVTSSTEVTLLGFGCRYDGSPGFGLLAEGRTNVTSVSADFVETGAGATLCAGDSGGAAYLAGTSAAHRRIIAVNHGIDGSRSLLSRVSNPEFRSWAVQWSASKKLRLCGLDRAAVKCRP